MVHASGKTVGGYNVNAAEFTDRFDPAAEARKKQEETHKRQEAAAEHRGVPVEMTNSIGQTLVMIPAGTFTIGQSGDDSDETPHQVTLTKPFYMGVFEVTNAQWKRVMGSVPSHWKDDNRPVENVSWKDAVEFCRKLSALPGERQAGRMYRLPTEAEWEYACRAGTTTKYSFGDDDSQLGDSGWFEKNSGNETHPVGEKKPNAWGLFDMRGNVCDVVQRRVR